MGESAKYLPVDDAHLPLSQRRFPFRAAGPHEQAEANRAIEQTLAGVERMIEGEIIRGIDLRDRDDERQNLLLHLARYTLPRFDAHSGTKVSTFLYVCMRSWLLETRRKYSRKRRKHLKTYPIPDDLPASWFVSDRPLEQLINDITKHPDKYMTGVQAQVLDAILSAEHGTLLQDISASCGYARSSSLSMVLLRIRRALREIAGDIPLPQ